MAEQRIAYSADKASAYGQLAEEIASVVAGETSRTARYATTVSLLKAAFGERFFWCGFYEVDPRKERELVVGPYQGTLGCLRIPFSRGVCGACATARETIVVPVFDASGALVAVLDVDSTAFAAFDEVDARGLEAACRAMMAG